jgi:AcrR family transcriptional regulator
LAGSKARRPGKVKRSRLTRPQSAERSTETSNLNFDTIQDDKTIKTQVSDLRLVNERRSHLIAVAIDLFSKKGYYDTTVKELAEVARVSPGLVYQYFEDKEDILFLSLQVVVHSINRVIPVAIEAFDHPVTKFAVAFRKYCEIVDQNRSAVQLTYRETKSLGRDYRTALKNMEIETNAIIQNCLHESIDRGFMRPVNTQLFVYQVITAAQTWSLKYWRLKSITNIDDYTEANLDVLLHAVLTAKGWSSYLKDIARSVAAA